MLQERAQKTYKEIPVYTEAFTTSASGAGVFTSEVVVAGSMLAH